MSYAPIKPPPCDPHCEKRNARCHIDCPDYIEWRNNRLTEEEKARKSYQAERISRDYQVSAADKMKQRSKK